MIQVKICGITNKKEIEYLNILKPNIKNLDLKVENIYIGEDLI